MNDPDVGAANVRIREKKINDFLDRWNERRQRSAESEMYTARSEQDEAALASSQRTLFRQLVGSFVGRFRPDRRDFRKRLEGMNGSLLNDQSMSEALGQMGTEALRRHLGVALPSREASRVLELYQMSFLPPPPPALHNAAAARSS